MYLVAIAWMYVVLMMAVAEALSSQGTVLGALLTLLLYGLLPLGIVLYIMGTPLRRRTRQALATEDSPLADGPAQQPVASDAPDGSRVAPGDGIASKREKI